MKVDLDYLINWIKNREKKPYGKLRYEEINGIHGIKDEKNLLWVRNPSKKICLEFIDYYNNNIFSKNT
jgi:hypothetical protein